MFVGWPSWNLRNCYNVLVRRLSSPLFYQPSTYSEENKSLPGECKNDFLLLYIILSRSYFPFVLSASFPLLVNRIAFNHTVISQKGPPVRSVLFFRHHLRSIRETHESARAFAKQSLRTKFNLLAFVHFLFHVAILPESSITLLEKIVRSFVTPRARECNFFPPFSSLEQLAEKVRTNHGYRVDVILDTFIIGALGTWDNKNEGVLRRLGIPKLAWRQLRCLSEAIKWSRDIYVEHTTGTRRYRGNKGITPTPLENGH
ncbi:hypothetical protein J437_LFUL005394 [Ladona fulva]|uniref:Uncharacterized protein n=1 Tax=Ladona fulva TaxID=123851 RepID=A0A8K0K4A4_LADFU|nr:hypothetical protein J437_LFUL005394 [Ladona fulva]